MTIKALEHIHQLLRDEVETCAKLEQSLREKRNIEEDKQDAGELNNYKKLYDRWSRANARLGEARDILDEFEYENWK